MRQAIAEKIAPEQPDFAFVATDLASLISSVLEVVDFRRKVDYFQ